MATPNYDINYNDKRFTKVESDKKAALTENEKLYSGMINNSDKYFQAQIDATNQWADKQSQLQQEQTDFAIEKIEQQKAQAQQDYTKEQSGAYVDWQKQSNQYGANAEQMAAQGMLNTGYSESSQVSMYNTYQNRVATAREAFMRATLNFDNSIKDAMLQNNAALAEIAYNAQKQALELSLQGFQYKNELIREKANMKIELDNMYYNRYQDVLKQVNTENALAEEVRQYNEKMAEEIRQYNASLAEDKRQFNASLAEQKRQFNETQASKNTSGGSKIKKTASGTPRFYVDRFDNKNKTSVNKTSSSAPEIDMDSVTALGYGPISASKLNSLVASGEVEEYMEGGVRKFRKTTKNKTLYNSKLQAYSAPLSKKQYDPILQAYIEMP